MKAVLDKAAAQVAAGVEESSGGGRAAGGKVAAVAGEAGSLSEGAETALLYVRFRATAESSLKALLAEVRCRPPLPFPLHSIT